MYVVETTKSNHIIQKVLCLHFVHFVQKQSIQPTPEWLSDAYKDVGNVLKTNLIIEKLNQR